MKKKFMLPALLCLAVITTRSENNTQRLSVTETFADKQMFPYMDTSLSFQQRAADLCGRMTIEEKTKLMLDVSQPIPRFNLKTFNWWSEALHGVANRGNVTVFPEPIGMAASFDDGMVYRVFDAVSDEARALYNDDLRNGVENRRDHSLSFWTPNVNIFRDPRWGRGQETYGEDPYLTSRMGVQVVRGLQGTEDSKYRKLYACAKHYAVHSGPEWSRHQDNITDVSPRDLHETYLPAFKALVQQGDVREVMCAYQRLDDEPCCGNTRLLQQILRDEWGFKHIVVSDCGAIRDFYASHRSSSDATHASAKAVLAGTDVECVGYAYESIPAAVRRGLISEKDVDEHVRRILEARMELGEMDDPSLVSWTKIPMSVVDSKEHQQLALDIARESMTLLQNNKNILPINKQIRKIAVVGPNADNKKMLWGNYNGTPSSTVSILDGIRNKIGNDKVVFLTGCDITDDKFTTDLIPECSIDGKKGMKVAYWNNLKMEGEPVATDRYTAAVHKTTMGAHNFSTGVNLKNFSGRFETVYKPTVSSDLVFKTSVVGQYTLWINDSIVDKRYAWHAVSSRIPYHVQAGHEYKIRVDYSQVVDFADAVFNLDFGKESPADYTALVKKLKGIDDVIFVGGISSDLEGEEMAVELPGFKGGDRTDIQLPASQRKCIAELKKAGKNIVMVNCSGSCVGLLPETKNCDAILQAWYGGEKGGQAVADILFGDYNPSGKLPVTFYADTTQLPAYKDYSMKHRTYRYMSDPLFPFGFGLSYTTFNIGNAKLSANVINAGENASIEIPVSNVGKREGTEVVQLYVRNLDDADGPLKSLKSFKRVNIPSGKTEKIKFALNKEFFEGFDTSTNTIRTRSGKYEVLYGTSSSDKDLKKVNVVLK